MKLTLLHAVHNLNWRLHSSLNIKLSLQSLKFSEDPSTAISKYLPDNLDMVWLGLIGLMYRKS